MAQELLQHDGWILCRNLQQTPVPGTAVLRRWAERGRVRPDDFLVNPSLECCVRAREVEDLNAIFRKARPFMAFVDRVRDAASRYTSWNLTQ
jgi:hypothetical protein